MITEKPITAKEQKRIDEEHGHELFRCMHDLCYMVDDFSEKWSDKALDPKRFLETAQELKKLKREINEFVAGKYRPKGPPEDSLQKWEFEFFIKDYASEIIQKYLGLPLSGKKTLKEELEHFVSIEPSKIVEMHDEAFANNAKLQEELNKMYKKWRQKDGINTKFEKKSSVEEAEHEVSKRKINLELAVQTKNTLLDYAIIFDALAGGADKSVEEQIKDLKFITRKKGESSHAVFRL
ncbi:hypothetical protein H0N99_05640 [Candidatus Micrarchaeota archaeon]|nr:hypothetical protein [Candidatus Micrarchaeota archaeon]